MNFQPISLADKALFHKYLAGHEFCLASYDFHSIYMWRNWEPYSYAIVGDALCIKSDFHGDGSYFFPIAAREETVLAVTEQLIELQTSQNKRFMMSEIDEQMIAFYERHWPGRFVAEEFPAGHNYVYLQKDLVELKGKRYAGKRNHVSKFLKTYPNYQFLPLCTNLVKGCKSQLESWMAQRDAEDIELALEYQGVLDALDNWGELDCVGAAILVENQVVAFTFGSQLNSSTFAIHVEKADTRIAGAYQAVNQFFARDYCERYHYINRAEDMGREGLRRAKLSYHPCRLDKKYFLRLAGN